MPYVLIFVSSPVHFPCIKILFGSVCPFTPLYIRVQVVQLCNMLLALLPSSSDETSKEKVGGLGIEPDVLECYFLVSLYWSLGASLVEESRIKFDLYVKKLAELVENPGEGAVAGPGEIPVHYPTMYEYFFDTTINKWVPWADKVPEYEHKVGLKFHEILVPTVDTIRNTWLLELMMKVKRPIVFVGETGTSKTATIQNFLRKLDSDALVSL